MCMPYKPLCNSSGSFGNDTQMDSFGQYLAYLAGAGIKGSFEKRILLFIEKEYYYYKLSLIPP